MEGVAAGRLYEDPDYLQQYVVYWDDNDVSGRTTTAEDEAYLSAENAAYLRKVSAARSFQLVPVAALLATSFRSFEDVLISAETDAILTFFSCRSDFSRFRLFQLLS